jgi:hypothetical protein
VEPVKEKHLPVSLIAHTQIKNKLTVSPAMNDTTGLVVPEDLMKSAASSSAVPPISPIMMIPSV